MHARPRSPAHEQPPVNFRPLHRSTRGPSHITCAPLLGGCGLVGALRTLLAVVHSKPRGDDTSVSNGGARRTACFDEWETIRSTNERTSMHHEPSGVHVLAHTASSRYPACLTCLLTVQCPCEPHKPHAIPSATPGCLCPTSCTPAGRHWHHEGAAALREALICRGAL